MRFAAPEALGLKPPRPAYSAVILLVPRGVAVVFKVAVPAINATVPREVVPSLKVTFPVGIPDSPTTVATRATDSPRKEGSGSSEVIVVTVSTSKATVVLTVPTAPAGPYASTTIYEKVSTMLCPEVKACRVAETVGS